MHIPVTRARAYTVIYRQPFRSFGETRTSNQEISKPDVAAITFPPYNAN